MRLRPTSDYLLCIQKNLANQEHNENGLYYSEENVPEYEVIETSIAVKVHNKFHAGDSVLSNSVPTKAKVGDKVFFLIKEENIIGKI